MVAIAAMVDRRSNPRRPASGTMKATHDLPRHRLERLRDAVAACQSMGRRVTMSGALALGLVLATRALEARYNDAEPFPPRQDRRLKGGRRASTAVGRCAECGGPLASRNRYGDGRGPVEVQREGMEPLVTHQRCSARATARHLRAQLRLDDDSDGIDG